jgi:hypothetical protein
MPIIKDKISLYKICDDQRFPRSGDAYDTLVGSMSRRTAGQLLPFVRPYLLQLSNCYVSLRQANEWGMRGLQGSFPRFKKQLPSNKTKRKNIIQSIVLVHNFHTEIMGCGQINAVFDTEYELVTSIVTIIMILIFLIMNNNNLRMSC